MDAPEQEIVYRGTVRHSYRTLRERVARLASALTDLGVKVAVEQQDIEDVLWLPLA